MAHTLTEEEIATIRSDYPEIVMLANGEIGLWSEDKQSGLIICEETLKLLVHSEATTDCVDAYRRGGTSDVFELVKREGLENEYCLIFGGKILFHSRTKEECDAHERSLKLCFTKWSPTTRYRTGALFI